jgi:hypothetical protein
MRTAASIKSLTQIKDVVKETAEKIRHVWLTHTESRREARDMVDQLLNTYGVEYLGRHKRTKHHIYYCNAGDGYTTTILFAGPRMYVGCWADLAEKNLTSTVQL